MRLRKAINQPQKLQDEMVFGRESKDPTKPTFPHLLRSQVVPFNPLLPPAAFPSLPFPRDSDGDGDRPAIAENDTDAEARSVVSDDEGSTECLHPRSRAVPNLSSLFDNCFEDQIASSDEDGNKARNNGTASQPSKVQAADGGCLNPKGIATSTVDWKDLGPAVRLSILSEMSECYPMTKVYDMLGLYAQELGDIRKLVARYNHQIEMEGYLTFWMQQDQLNGILRTDHTSTLRGAPEAYQEFQTQSYMRKIQAEVDESLLQATRDEVSLGARFLAQQGIQREMIGSWKNVYSYIYAAQPRDNQIQLPAQPLLARRGLDSGYASAVITPNKTSTGEESDSVSTSSPQIHGHAIQGTDPKRKPRLTNSETVELQTKSASAKVHRSRHWESPSPRRDPTAPADDASAAGSSGRSRRNVRPNSRYEEAIAELRLRGSGDGMDNDYEMLDESDQDPSTTEAPKPLPRLRVTPDNRIIRAPAPSSIAMANPKSGAGTTHINPDRGQIPPVRSSNVHLTTSKRVASPLPLQRVIVRSSKPVAKPKQPKKIAQSSEDSLTNKSNQSLLGIPRGRNDFTRSLLKASQRDAASATTWISTQHQDLAEPMLSSVGNPQRRSGAVVATAFSPTTGRFRGYLNREPQGTKAAVHSPPGSIRLQKIDLTADESGIKRSLLATPGSTSTLAPDLRPSTMNGRSMVTETGSPVPHTRNLTSHGSFPTSNCAISNLQDGPTTGHEETAAASGAAGDKPRSGRALANVFRRLHPITGNVILDPSTQQDHSPGASLGERITHVPCPPRSAPPEANDEAGKAVQKAAINLTDAATTPTKTTFPLIDLVAEPLKGRRRHSRPPDPSTTTTEPSSSRQDPGEKKRKYTKSEAQRQKESSRLERMERERKEREKRLAANAAEGEEAKVKKKVERAVAVDGKGEG